MVFKKDEYLIRIIELLEDAYDDGRRDGYNEGYDDGYKQSDIELAGSSTDGDDA